MIFRSPRHFLGILFKLKEKKNQIPALGQDLPRGLRPYGPAACAASGASRLSRPVWPAKVADPFPPWSARLVSARSRFEALVVDGQIGQGRRGRWREWWRGRQQRARSEQWWLGFSFVFRCRAGLVQAKIFEKVVWPGQKNLQRALFLWQISLEVLRM
jgi:hypothetical protein